MKTSTKPETHIGWFVRTAILHTVSVVYEDQLLKLSETRFSTCYAFYSLEVYEDQVSVLTTTVVLTTLVCNPSLVLVTSVGCAHTRTHTHTHTPTHTYSPLATCEVCVSIHLLWGPPFLLEVSKKKYGCLVAYLPISLNTWLDFRKFQIFLWGLCYEDLPITQLWILMGTTCHTILMGTYSPNLWGLCFHSDTLLARTTSSDAEEEEKEEEGCLVACLL